MLYTERKGKPYKKIKRNKVKTASALRVASVGPAKAHLTLFSLIEHTCVVRVCVTRHRCGRLHGGQVLIGCGNSERSEVPRLGVRTCRPAEGRAAVRAVRATDPPDKDGELSLRFCLLFVSLSACLGVLFFYPYYGGLPGQRVRRA